MYIDIVEMMRDLLTAGGVIFQVILVVTLGLWILIVERSLYQKLAWPPYVLTVMAVWKKRVDKRTWQAHRIREMEVSRASIEINALLPLIKTIVALCPLLGLLGTVTGMIQVFDNMALSGTGDARMMAAGISMATLPTMAGMVAALSGLYFGNRLETSAAMKVEILAEQMTFN